ncbi:MAG: nucleoside 2-deoxyribosyltransferase [Bacillota bacterium]
MLKECLYIAGPECFYRGGFDLLNAMRRRAETLGFSVSLPNDDPLNLDHADLRLNADAIFANCRDSMNRSTAIIADLEFYRGPEADGGTIYEIGMAYARGMRCYGYTRDKRNMVWKYQGYLIKDGEVYDKKGRVLPYKDLPFSPNVIGSTKIVQGDFDDCLQTLIVDIEEERKKAGAQQRQPESASACIHTFHDGRPVIFLAGPERYDRDAVEKYKAMQAKCSRLGLTAFAPTDAAPEIPLLTSDDPYTRAYNTFSHNQQHVRNCDILLANLNDFHGWEPESDTSFECGMAFQLGKRLYAYVDDATIMKNRVPHLGEANEYRDPCGCNVENFDYPLNLMFSSSMEILEGDFEAAIEKIAKDLKVQGIL